MKRKQDKKVTVEMLTEMPDIRMMPRDLAKVLAQRMITENCPGMHVRNCGWVWLSDLEDSLSLLSELNDGKSKTI